MSQDTLDLNPALAARYASAQAALPTPPAGANTAVLQHLLAHRSVRAYLPDALPEGTLAHLVAAAQSAPTSSNLQAWSVLAVTDPERKARLSEWSRDQAHIRQAPLFLVWLADLSRLDRVAQGLGLPSDANQYLEQFLVASIDASLAAQNPEVAAELKLPAHVFPLFGLCVGHPDPAQPAAVKPRLAQSVVLHQEHYSTDAEAGGVPQYDQAIQAFQRDQGLPPVPWSLQASQRVAGPQSLSGRDHLRRFITWQGFELA